jgi:hypothetical protein
MARERIGVGDFKSNEAQRPRDAAPDAPGRFADLARLSGPRKGGSRSAWPC